MFVDNLLTLMTSDSSLNTLVTGNIVYNHLPVDFNTSKTHIVFNFAKVEDIPCMNATTVYSNYNLECQLVAPDLTDVVDIAEELNTYLTNYSNNNFIEINFRDEVVNFNTEKGVYYKNHNFTIMYVE